MSAPANEYETREEGGRIRRLGQFDGPVTPPTTRHEEVAEGQEPETTEDTSSGPSASIVALVLLALGIITTSVGVGLWAGIGPALITLGVGTFFVGFRIAQDND